MIIVEEGDPHHPQATALLRESHALMQKLFPPEDNFYLSIDDLCAPNIRFFTGRDGEAIVGTGALATMDGYGEVKSMFVSEGARGKGVADAILRQIEDAARQAGLPSLKLETGNSLQAAHNLYQRHGFSICGAFGDYPETATSVFMQKALD